MQEIITTMRDCFAREIPSGSTTKIPKGSFLTITQDLGGNYSVLFDGRMFRVDGIDADALGKEKLEIDFNNRENQLVTKVQVKEILKTIYDPEIPVSIVDLGLIYSIEIDHNNSKILIDMTLTAPTCGMGAVIIEDIKYRVCNITKIKEIEVNLVFDPPWDRSMMSEEALLETGLIW